MSPTRAPHPCNAPGCPHLVRSGRYCPDHQAARQARQDADRGTAAQRGYGAEWRKLRRMALVAHPLCADPFHVHGDGPVIATDVDHIKPRNAGGGDTLDNLQCLCHSCHSRKTAAIDGGFGVGRGDRISTDSTHETARRALNSLPRNARRGVHGGS